MKIIKHIRILTILALTAAIAFGTTARAEHPDAFAPAMSITVTTGFDEDDGYVGGGMGVSLREALTHAADGATITIPAGVYTLDADSHSGITVSSKVKIKGAGREHTIIDAGNNGRIITVSAGGHAEIQGITFRNGKADRGGAILNEGALTLIDAGFVGNHAEDGGAIYTAGFTTVLGTMFESNHASYLGGGICAVEADVLVSGTSFLKNTAHLGGGIYNRFSMLVLESTTLYGNLAGSGAGIKDYVGFTRVGSSSLAENFGGNFEGSFISLGNNYEDDGSSGFTDGVNGDTVQRSAGTAYKRVTHSPCGDLCHNHREQQHRR
ncbi:MAG: hypothetical protein CL946_01730 [Ectothiorhodospiraceae bacterium]|nr:hypothetical protein [Ectothiorhodospiraceae bacterium]